jgi:hypothetical protein
MLAHCVTCMLVFTRYCNFRKKKDSGINTVKTPVSNAVEFVCAYVINHLPPNDIYVYIGRTELLTSRRCVLNIYSTNIRTEYFKHAA